MPEAIVLMSHTPDPRMERRIRLLCDQYQRVQVCYLNRFGELGSAGDSRAVYTPLKAASSRNLFLRLVREREVLQKVVRVLQQDHPDLVYVDGADMLLPAVQFKKRYGDNTSMIVAEIADIPVLRYEQRYGRIARLLSGYVNQLLASTDLLVLTSEAFWTNYYVRLMPQMYHCVVLNCPESAQFRSFSRTPHDGFNIGFVGLIRYARELENLMISCADLRGVRVVIAGGGPELSTVQEMAQSFENVAVTGPYSYADDVPAIYSDLDAIYCVYPTSMLNVRLAMPNKLYEAIQCRLPIIVSRGTALGDFVVNKSIGIAVDPGNPVALRTAILQLVQDDTLRQEIARRCDLLRDRYTWEQESIALRTALSGMRINKTVV